jgi:ribonuclease R
VQVKSVDYYRQQIDLVTVGPDGLPKGMAANTTNGDSTDIYSANKNESFDLEPYDEE